MSVPLNLPAGYILVYGQGIAQSAVGIEIPDQQSDIRFGSVYQIWDGGAAFIYGGDNVMFNYKDGARLVFSNIEYTMIPAKLVTKENIPL